ncbi:hypothetical protein BJ742DRAFT_743548 [Cladochytrium replicatum]|nr:hypothetical protein BJ742DRAFT_743548 [Cladochytrium replicatum]
MSDLTHSGTEIQLKILQTMLPLMTYYETLHGEVLSEILFLCFKLQDPNNSIVNNIASATLRQVVILVFDKMAHERESTNGDETITDQAGSGRCAKDAFLLFQDLWAAIGGEPPQFLKIASFPKGFGLELTESILLNHHALIKMDKNLISVLKEKACPLIIKTFSDRNDFPITIRLMRVIQIMIKYFQSELIMEFGGNLNDGNFLALRGMIGLQIILRGRATHPVVYRKIIVSERPISTHSPSILGSSGSPEQTHMGDGFVLSTSSSSMKVACLDQLDKGEPPQIPEMSMVDSVWNSILPSFSYLVTASVDDDIFVNVVKSFQNFTTMLGLHRLNTQRDAFLSAFCKVCTPAGSGHDSGKDVLSSTGSGYGGSSTSTPSRTSRRSLVRLGEAVGLRCHCLEPRLPDWFSLSVNATVIRALLSFAQTCTRVLEDKAWYLILDIPQAAEMLVTTGKMGKKENSAISLIREEGALSQPKASNARLSTALGGLVPPNIAHGPSTATLLENQFASTLTLVRKLYDSTKGMDDSSISDCSAKDSMKVADEKSIAVARLHDVAILNVARIIGPHSAINRYLVWDTVVGSLIEMAHPPTVSVSIRNQVLWTFSEILAVAIQTPSIANDREAEMKILEPLKRILLVSDAGVLLGPPASEGSLLLQAPSSTPTAAEKANKGGWFVDVQRTGLDKILQSSGQQMSSGWEVVFDIVKSVVVSIVKSRKNSYGDPESVSTPDPGVSIAAGAVSKAAQFIRIALRSGELIITDFLSQIQAPVLRQCIETVGFFGSQTEDLNVSLASVNLLWSIADFVLKSSGQVVDGSDSAEKIKPASSIGSGMYIFGTLSQRCSDPRSEVRNSANQTLFRTIGINGKLLTLEAWDEFIWNILFPLLERVKVANERTEQAAKLQQQMLTPGSPAAAVVAASPQRKSSVSSAPPKVVVHHSRNTPAKQWDETKVITLAGFSKCLVDFLPTLIKLNDRFERAWSLFLEYVKEWCLSGSPEVSNAAIKALRVLVKTEMVEAVSQEGASSISATESVEYSQTRKEEPPSSMIELWKLETLNLYVGTFGEIYDVVKDSFGVYELRRLLCILSHVLTYHTTAPTTQGAGPNAARIARAAADFMMNDVETLTPLQQSVLDIVSGVARPSILDAAEGVHIKSMQTKKSFIDSHQNLQTIYSAQVFEQCIGALGVAMQARHAGPSGGAREMVPLWKQGAQIWLDVNVTGLSASEQFVAALPQSVIDKIYTTLVETFDRFMTTAVQAPSSMSSEDILADAEFDLSFLQSVEKDIAPTLGKSHVSDAVIQKFVDVIRTATKVHCPRTTNGSANLAPPPMGKQLSTIAADEKKPVSKIRGDAKEEVSSPSSTEPVTSSMEDLAHAQQLGIAADVVPVPKYKLAEACIDFLFHLCADNPAGMISVFGNRYYE